MVDCTVSIPFVATIALRYRRNEQRARERDRKRERERPIIPFPRALVGIALSIAPLFPFAFFLQQNPSRRKGESAAPRLDGRETDEWRRPGHERGWVAASFEAATKGSGNYGEAANSREAEAKAAVGSQADLRRGFAPTFIRAARPFCAASSVDARRRRPEFPPADPIQSHVALVPLSLSLSLPPLSLLIFVIPASLHHRSAGPAVSLLRFDRAPSISPRLFFRLEKPCD